jgi:ketosteroid isomerase-like protein
MITLALAEQFAAAWIAAWNAHDLERIFEHYTDDFLFSSPLIIERGFASSGTLRGKDAIRPYWSAGLAAKPPLRFEIIEVFAGADCVSIHYRSVGRKLVCETFFVDAAFKVVRSASSYGRQA